MQIRIHPHFVKAWNKFTYRVAAILLPPPVPAFTVLGYNIDWTDIGVVAWTVLGITVLVLYTGNPWWIPTMALSLILAWAVIPSGKETRNEENPLD